MLWLSGSVEDVEAQLGMWSVAQWLSWGFGGLKEDVVAQLGLLWLSGSVGDMVIQ
jgi:hypothetical protein